MPTVRLKEEHGRLLDKLYGYYRQKGISVTKQDLMGKLIEDAAEREGLINDEPEEDTDTLTQLFSLLDRAPDWGVADAAAKVDEFVYGLEKSPPTKDRDS